MKKILSAMILSVLTILLLLMIPGGDALADTVIWDGVMPAADADATFSGGSGSSSGDPYLIATAADLAQLSANVNAGDTYSGVYFAMTADIYLNSIAGWTIWTKSTTGLNSWTPIGNPAYSFQGVFDGEDNAVYGIYISSDSAEYQGLFGVVGACTIQNLTVTSGFISALNYAGAIAGQATASGSDSGAIANCRGGVTVGCGYYDRTTDTSYGGAHVGGIVGSSTRVSLVNCASTRVAQGYSYLGGVAGDVTDADVTGCYSGTNNVTGGNDAISYTNIGGVVGLISSGTVSRCFNTGRVSTYIARYIGGVVGNAVNSTIEYCYNAGLVDSSGDYAGGVLGNMDNDTILRYCFNAGRVYGNTNNTGGVTGIRTATSNLSDCYYDKQISPYGGVGSQTNPGAIGLNTPEMIGPGLYGKLGDNANWTFASGLYPRLADNGSFDLDGSDAAIVSASPLRLAPSDTSNAVTQGFKINADATWYKSGSLFDSSTRIGDGSSVIIAASGTMLTAFYGSAQKFTRLIGSGPVGVTTANSVIYNKGNGTVGGAALSVTTKRAPANAPAAPTLSSKTDATITVVAVSGQEYAVKLTADADYGAWQGGGTFSGLTAATSYSIVTRIKETDSAMPSKTSSALTVVTKAAAPAAPAAPTVTGRTDTTITVSVAGSQEYAIKPAADTDYGPWQDGGSFSGVFASLTPNTTYHIVTRVKETGDAMLSAASSPATATTKQTGPAAPDAPTLGFQRSDAIGVDALPGNQYGISTINDASTIIWGAAINTAAVLTFDGLSPATKHYIWGRVAGTEGMMPSAAAYIEAYTAYAAPAASVAAIDYGLETISYDSAYEVYTAESSGTLIADSASVTPYIPAAGSGNATIYVRARSNGGIPASAWTGVTVRARPATPDSSAVTIHYAAETIGYGSAYEVYTAKSSGTLIADSASVTAYIPAAGSADAAIYARRKATSDTFASAWRSVAIPARPATPPAPTLGAKTDVSATLTTASGLEYSIEGGAWQDGGGFSGLSQNTPYRFYARVKATADSFTSAVSPALPVTTKTAPADPPPAPTLMNKTDTTITVAAAAGQEYSIDGSIWQDTGAFSSLSANTTYNIVTRVKESDIAMAGLISAPLSVTTDSLSKSKFTITAKFTKDQAWINPFKDVGEGDWFYDAVAFVSAEGLMYGTSEDTFSPEAPMTRAMIVTILWRLEGCPTASGSPNKNFIDMDDSQWYSEAVAWAVMNGIVTGYGGTRFGPADAVTREQLAAILYRYAIKKGCDMSVSDDLTGFIDTPGISSWALDSIGWAIGSGLINGTPQGAVDPLGSATRAQTAAILMRFVESFF